MTDMETPPQGNEGKEIVVVASKIKSYIKTQAGMNTSAAVMDILSEKVRQLCKAGRPQNRNGPRLHARRQLST